MCAQNIYRSSEIFYVAERVWPPTPCVSGPKPPVSLVNDRRCRTAGCSLGCFVSCMIFLLHDTSSVALSLYWQYWQCCARHTVCALRFPIGLPSVVCSFQSLAQCSSLLGQCYPHSSLVFDECTAAQMYPQDHQSFFRRARITLSDLFLFQFVKTTFPASMGTHLYFPIKPKVVTIR